MEVSQPDNNPELFRRRAFASTGSFTGCHGWAGRRSVYHMTDYISQAVGKKHQENLSEQVMFILIWEYYYYAHETDQLSETEADGKNLPVVRFESSLLHGYALYTAISVLVVLDTANQHGANREHQNS
jgi:hypothetical protein